MSSEKTFADFGFDEKTKSALDAFRFTTPTPIQEQTIPIIMEGKDIVACAQTGTGKTAAFLLPVIDRIAKSNIEHTYCLVIVPTRELAMQIEKQCEGFSYFTDVSVYAVYGGGSGEAFQQEKQALSSGVQIIIATPGRLISHLNMGYVKFDQVGVVVLDEADKMLDMGFYDDLLKIFGYLPKKRQSLLFSATMPPKMRALSERILNQPEKVSIAISKPAAGIVQQAYMCYESQKIGLLERILSDSKYGSVIVFASRKDNANKITSALRKRNLNAKVIHSDLDQQEREDVLRKFTNKDYPILVATDILSRGIHIDDIGLVVNYEVPGDAEDYVHRIGRTARAASKGEAITLITEEDQYKFLKIEELIERTIDKLPMPADLGEAPQYNPSAKRPSRGSGSNRPFNRKKGFKPNRK